ncbi:MAG: hypothetical protein CEN88_50 [Candidatus Berkelbacteria bacterium Licking1014_2]|uniref:Fibronectin type-III domain-containing protein n=1 Tax=Candidatus Berkelbacteria bacterium Licking1014_2 TaxID=2017146 RepID=A0A554LX27_9BACT|nr:MAG: hypothetical protein CEN88_50 [Candidatus Berkelbacteria bacterium Licking1014_2]
MKLFSAIVFKRLTALLVVVLCLGLIAISFPKNQLKIDRVKAGSISSVTVTASSGSLSTSANYTITFTPATAATSFSFVSLNFSAPPEARFGVSSATLAAGSSAVFTEITERNSEYGSIGIQTSSLPAQELTLIINGIINPPKAGIYPLEIRTHEGWNELDNGLGSVTIGTIALQGKVYLANGVTAARGAWVEAEDTTDFSKRYGSQSDASGNYGIGGLESGKSYRINIFLGTGDPNANTKGYVAPSIDNITYSGTTIIKNITLEQSTKTVSGKLLRQSGAAVSNARVNAMRMDSPGFLNGQTNASGNYTLLMSGGRWEIRPDTYSGPGQEAVDYAFSGPGFQIKFAKDKTVETKTNVDFTVLTANSTITGKVNPKPSNQFSGIGLHNKSGFGTGTGLDNAGSFSFRVPAGSYELDMFSDPNQAGDRYAMPAMDPITVKDNETKNLGTINLVKMDKTINALVRENISKTGLPGFGVGCFQPRGGAFSHGQTGSDGKAAIAVTEGEWGCMAMSGFGGPKEGGPGGPGALWQKLLLLRAYAAENQRQETKYITMGGPQFVKVSGSTSPTVTFDAVEANRTITVTIQDSSGNSLQEYGFVEAELVGSDLGDDFGKGGLGQPIDPNVPGMASIQVPAGVYDLRLMTPPGSDYSSGDPTRVDVTNGNAAATIKLLTNDSTIAGTLKDEDGNTVTGVMAFVTATNPKGAFIPGDVDSSSGTFSMRVPSAGGTLNLGYFVNPDSGYFPQPFSDAAVTPVAGQTHSKDIVMKKASVTVNITVKDPNGNAVANAFVEADNRKAESKGKVGHFFNYGDQTDSNGQITLRLPADEFSFKAFLPPETLRANKWLPPKKTTQTLTKDSTVNITLTFQAADVEIKGQAKKSDGTTVDSAFITAYSDSGEAIETTTDSTGNYTIYVTSGDWHVVGKKDDTSANSTQPTPLSSGDVAFATGTNKNITKNLTVTAGDIMSSAVTSSFDSDNSKVVRLTDGSLADANVSIPQDALDSDGEGGNVSVTAQSTVEIPHQLLDKPLGAGLDISASSSSGQAISSLNSSVAITIPLERQDLTNSGLTTGDIGKTVVMSYYDETNGKWAPLEGSITYIEKDATGDGDTTDATDKILVTGQSSHFTVFALTAATDSIAPAAPTGISATAGAQKVTLSWTNPTDADFAGIKVYRSTTEGTVGDLVTTVSSATTTSYENTGLTNGTKYYYVVRSYDTSGNISTNTTQVNGTPGALPTTGQKNIFRIIIDWVKNLF